MDTMKLVGKRVTYRTMQGALSGRVIARDVDEECVKVQVDRTHNIGVVNVQDIIKVYDDDGVR